jgi:hypothetical protein
MRDFQLVPRPVNFVGGPLDGINYVSPAAALVLYAEGNKAGRYLFDGTSYQWISDNH